MADNNTPTKIKSADEIKVKRKPSDIIFTIVFTIICAFWVYPLIMVLINSFKEKLSISRDPFNLPDEKSQFLQGEALHLPRSLQPSG